MSLLTWDNNRKVYKLQNIVKYMANKTYTNKVKDYKGNFPDAGTDGLENCVVELPESNTLNKNKQKR